MQGVRGAKDVSSSRGAKGGRGTRDVRNPRGARGGRGTGGAGDVRGVRGESHLMKCSLPDFLNQWSVYNLSLLI